MDINGWISIAMITIYVLTFIYQRDRIKDLKDKMNTLESFTKIFDVKKVEEFVEMSNKASELKAANFIVNSDEMQKIAMKTMNDAENEFAEYFAKEKGEEFLELLNMVGNTIYQNIENEENLALILDKLPKTRHLFEHIIDNGKNQQ